MIVSLCNIKAKNVLMLILKTLGVAHLDVFGPYGDPVDCVGCKACSRTEQPIIKKKEEKN